ncbi:glycosyltransferase family 9 protein [Vibrio agarivorans]|uniref:glycosyltransferase family 9 protein n=1 Tax=Vibrio agarivorans TaxID=153622 RepID=UPI0025B2813D|nr:glycosyltransferase family 9 protein [Vibrio agarivorans]MDN3662175.1 glycosyltransferase family 9 protein [Vibrio agarivorans]
MASEHLTATDLTAPKILLVLTRYLGDTLLMTGVLRSLRSAYPKASITALVAHKGRFALEGNGDLDELLVVEDKFSLSGMMKLLQSHFRRYDWVINDKASGKSEIYAFLFGKLGSKTSWQARVLNQNMLGTWRSKAPFNHHCVLDDDDREHRMVRSMKLLEPLPVKVQAQIVVPSIPVALSLPMHYLVLHVPASNDLKQWSISNWRQLVDGLLHSGISLVLTGAPSERDKRLVSEVMNGLEDDPQVIDLSGKLSIAEMATVVKQSAGYIGPDGGTTHLASAFDIPIFCIVSVANAVMWGPWPYQMSIEDYQREPYEADAEQQVRGNVSIFQAHPDATYALQRNIHPQNVLSHVLAVIERNES